MDTTVSRRRRLVMDKGVSAEIKETIQSHSLSGESKVADK